MDFQYTDEIKKMIERQAKMPSATQEVKSLDMKVNGAQYEPKDISNVDEITKAWNNANQPKYNGLSPDAYKNTLVQKAQAGVNSSADAQMATIQQNLAETLAAINSERASAAQNYQKNLETIHNNEFVTTESQKEIMNQGGWNANNSGLAVGEVGKIKIGADKQRADANASLSQLLADISNRASLAQTRASNDKSSVEKWKEQQLAGAEAEALINSENRNYGMYRDSVSDNNNNRNFEYTKDQDAKKWDYQENRDNVADAWNEKTFNYGAERDKVADVWKDKEFSYQVSRDNVLDERWLKQFTAEEQHKFVQEALDRKQISISEANAALSRQKYADDKIAAEEAAKRPSKEQVVQGTTSEIYDFIYKQSGSNEEALSKLSQNKGYLLSKMAEVGMSSDQALTFYQTMVADLNGKTIKEYKTDDPYGLGE
jgi:hypothetical protein